MLVLFMSDTWRSIGVKDIAWPGYTNDTNKQDFFSDMSKKFADIRNIFADIRSMYTKFISLSNFKLNY